MLGGTGTVSGHALLGDIGNQSNGSGVRDSRNSLLTPVLVMDASMASTCCQTGNFQFAASRLDFYYNGGNFRQLDGDIVPYLFPFRVNGGSNTSPFQFLKLHE